MYYSTKMTDSQPIWAAGSRSALSGRLETTGALLSRRWLERPGNKDTGSRIK